MHVSQDFCIYMNEKKKKILVEIVCASSILVILGKNFQYDIPYRISKKKNLTEFLSHVDAFLCSSGLLGSKQRITNIENNEIYFEKI